MYNINKIITQTGPIELVQSLYASLKSFIEIKNGKEFQRFNLDRNGSRKCFLLYSGTCVVMRSVDSLVLSTITAPCMIGIHDFFHAKSDIHVYAVSDIQYAMTNVELVMDFIERKDLWKGMTYMLMLSATRFSEYQHETVGIKNYELICNLLNSLNNESFEIRATTSALEYIQSRSLLSRSGIMKTLASLKTGGYIVIKKGLLIKLNTLPKNF